MSDETIQDEIESIRRKHSLSPSDGFGADLERQRENAESEAQAQEMNRKIFDEILHGTAPDIDLSGCPPPIVASAQRLLAAFDAVRRQCLEARGKGEKEENEAAEQMRKAYSAVAMIAATVDAGADWIDDAPEIKWLIRDTLADGDLVFIIGKAKAMKSWFALQLAICLAAGVPWFKKEIVGRQKVLYLNLEMKSGCMRRRHQTVCDQLGIERGSLRGWFYYANLRRFTSTIATVIPIIQEYKPSVVVVDPFYQFDGDADECDMKERKRIMREIMESQDELGFTCIIIHHDGKGDNGEKDIRDGGAGSSVINRSAELTIYIKDYKGKESDSELVRCIEILGREIAGESFTIIKQDATSCVFNYDGREPITSGRKGRAGTTSSDNGKADKEARRKEISDSAQTIANWIKAQDCPKTATEIKEHADKKLNMVDGIRKEAMALLKAKHSEYDLAMMTKGKGTAYYLLHPTKEARRKMSEILAAKNENRKGAGDGWLES